MAHTWGITRPVLQPPSLRRSFHTRGQTAFLHQALYAERRTHQPSTSPDTMDEVPASSAAAASSAGDLLSWSFVEGPPEESSQQQQQQQQQQRRQQSRQRPQRQQQPDQGQQHKRQQPAPGRGGHPETAQQRHGKGSKQHKGLGTTTEKAAPARGSQQHAAAARSGQRQQQGQRCAPREPPQASGVPAAGLSNAAFRAAQQRVLQLLVEADISNPVAAAEQLPDSVDEVIIALQLLATAPRPREHTALRQYEDAAAAVAAAVIAKLKRLLLGQQQQQQQQQQSNDGDEAGSSVRLAAALAQLPATKVAAATFALGVLRQYDPCLVPALEAAAGQLLARSAFSANQLGQLAQGFAYLDHTLSPGWQQVYLLAVGRQLPGLTAAQLASLSEFLLKYRLRAFLCGTFALGSSSVDPAARAGVAVAAGNGLRALPAGSNAASSSIGDLPAAVLPAAWVSGFLEAAGSQAHSLKPSQLAQVLAAAAAIHQQQQATSGSSGERAPAALAGLPLSLEPAADSGTPSSSSKSRWLVRLLAAFQQLLPDMTMPYLAAALPALAALTNCPWPEQQLRPVLLQVRLLLPAAGGPEAVAATAGAAQLAGSGRHVSVVDGTWCDALLQRLHVLLPGLGAAELASVIRMLLLLTLRPYRAWVYELCARLRVEVPGFGATELVDVLEGLARLRIVLDPEVLHLFVIGVKRWLPLLGQGELARVAGSLRRMYPRGLPGRTVQHLVEEVERRGRFLQLQQQQQLQLPP